MKFSHKGSIFIEIFFCQSLVCDLPHGIYIYQGNKVFDKVVNVYLRSNSIYKYKFFTNFGTSHFTQFFPG